MNLKALVVEQLEADGTVRTFRLRPGLFGELIVALPRDYDEERSGPLHFLNREDEENYINSLASCRARRLGSDHFKRNGEQCLLQLSWRGIPTSRHELALYVLNLPTDAVISELKILDPHRPGKEYLRTIYRDDQKKRYSIYLQCQSTLGSFDFDLRCTTAISHQSFQVSQYSDAHTSDGYQVPPWGAQLSAQQAQRVETFFEEPVPFDVEHSGSIRVFLSSAPADEVLRRQLETHLSPLKRAGLIRIWHPGQGQPGSEWERELHQRIDDSDIVILLISSDYLSSGICVDIHMHEALKRQADGYTKIIPVLIRPVRLTGTPLEHLHCLPRNGSAVTKWTNSDEAWQDVVDELSMIIQKN